MKAVIQFSLPEEEADFQLAINGKQFAIALSDIDELFRQINKGRVDSDELNQLLNDKKVRRFYELLAVKVYEILQDSRYSDYLL